MHKSLMGQAVPRKEGIEKVTGRARYIDDLTFPGMLHGVTVRSQVPRGRIRDIAFDGAIPWDEFVIVTAKDIPGHNAVALILEDQPYLADEVVNHPEEAVVLLAHHDRYLLEEARRHAKSHDLSDRVNFEVATAKDIGETGYDLVTFFDCLHDMGDPRGCARHMRRILKDDGAWMIVEPIAGDRPADNLNPVGRLYYNASTMICVPTSLDQEVGEGLGAQAGEAKLSEVIRDGGFTRVRRATEGPFNMVLEARA